MEFVLCPIGTFGDVKPFLELGTRLRQRGHRVLMVTAAPFREHAENRDLEFAPTLSEPFYRAVLEDPRLWHSGRFFETLVSGFIGPSLRPVVEIVRAQPRPHRLTLVAAFCGSPAARLAQEITGARMVSLWVDPSGLQSNFSPPVYSGAPFVRFLPRVLRSVLLGIVHRYADFLASRVLDPARRELGLEPVRSMLGWMVSRQASIGMFPEWFAPRQPDWPVNFQYAGFPVAPSNQSLPEDVERFLKAGSPPVVITFGTAMIGAHREFAASLEACQQLGLRTLLISPNQNLPNLTSSKDSMISGYVPFDRLLPFAAALIHHAGMGTCAQSLAAGVPQLLIPLAHDQPDNAARLVKLGAGRSLSRQNALRGKLARELAKLLASDSRQVCQRLAASLPSRPDGLDRACEALERP